MNFDRFCYRVIIDKSCYLDDTKVTLWGENENTISDHAITITIRQLRNLMHEVTQTAELRIRELGPAS